MDPTKAISNVVMSMVRTLVPGAISSFVAYLATRWGIIVDEQTKMGLVLLASAIIFGIYYFLIRMFETYVSPKFGWFLGDFRKGLTAPVYPDAIETTVVPPAN